MDLGENGTEDQGAMRRRTVVKGAAWAAPVVTLGAAAPAEAASPTPITPSVSWTCTEARNDAWQYTVALTLSNGLSCETSVRVSLFTLSVDARVLDNGTGVVHVPAGQSRTMTFTSGPTTRSGAGTVTLTYTYRDCGGDTRQESRALQLNALASCGGDDKDVDKKSAEPVDKKSAEPTPLTSPNVSPTAGTTSAPTATPSLTPTPAPVDSSTSGAVPTPVPTPSD